MGFFKKIVGFFGLGNHDLHEVNREDEDENDVNGNKKANSVEGTHFNDYSNLPRKGFSVQVPVDRAHHIGPVLVPCAAVDGGVQGLGWYTRRLKIDEDGDVADEFLDEVYPETVSGMEVSDKPLPKFELKLSTKPAKARNPCLSGNGMVQQYVEFRGRLQLV